MYETGKRPSATASLELAATAKTKFDEFLRRQLGIADARDPDTVVSALRKLYPHTAARLDDESKGMAIRFAAEPEAPAAAPMGSTESPGVRRYRLAREALEADLTFVMELASNRAYKVPLGGWRDAIIAELGEGEDAAYGAVDPVARDRTFYSVRKLGDYARVARMVGLLNPMVNPEFRRLASTLEETALILRVMAGEALFRAGFDQGGTGFQVALVDLRQRREALIGTLERFTAATSEGSDDWGDGEASYGKLLEVLGAQGHQDLRSIVRPDAMSRLLDVLLESAPKQRPEDLRGIAATVPIELLQLRRLYEAAGSLLGKVGGSVDGEAASAPLAAFVTALKLFIDAFDRPGAGARLLNLVLPLPLATLDLATTENGSAILRLLFQERARLQVTLDSLHADPNFDPPDWDLAAKLDRTLYDFDRVADLYLLDCSAESTDEGAMTARFYGWVLKKWLEGSDWQRATPQSVDPQLKQELYNHLKVVADTLAPNLDLWKDNHPELFAAFMARKDAFLREQCTLERKSLDLALTLTQAAAGRRTQIDNVSTLYTVLLPDACLKPTEYRIPSPLRVSIQRLAESNEKIEEDISEDDPVSERARRGRAPTPPGPAPSDRLEARVANLEKAITVLIQRLTSNQADGSVSSAQAQPPNKRGRRGAKARGPKKGEPAKPVRPHPAAPPPDETH